MLPLLGAKHVIPVFYCITLNIFNLRLHKQKRKSMLQMKKYGKQSIFADHVTYLYPYFDFLLS